MAAAALTNLEVMKVVERHIGVHGGYLGDFSYRTHAEFYPLYCDVDIDPFAYEGTTRERFIAILQESPPDVQAKILRGVLERFPLAAPSAPPTRTPELQQEISRIAERLERVSPIDSPSLRSSSQTVTRAIADAQVLLHTTGAASAVDRIHTAVHGHLRQLCDDGAIAYERADSCARLLKLLREHHPAFQSLGVRQEDVRRILQALGAILDALSPVRNAASMAHANEHLLDEHDAMLAVNATRTIMHYLDARFSGDAA